MKKGIIVLLITLLAATSVFALDFHGSFRAGYQFTFGDEVAITDVSRLKDLAGRFSISSSAEGDGWSLDLWSPAFDSAANKDYYGYYGSIKALLTVDYSATLGLPEDVSAQFMLGDNGFSIYVPYLDPTSYSYNYIDSVGDGIMAGASFGYKNYSITGAIDPVSENGKSGIVYAGADYGFVSVGAGMQIKKDALDVEAGFVFDVAEVAQLDDISAKVSALYQYAKENDNHDLFIAVSGGYDAISAYAEFIAQLTAKEYDLNAGVSYNLGNGVSVGADGSFEFDGDKAIAGAGWAKCKLNGVTYQAWLGYKKNVYAKAQATLSF